MQNSKILAVDGYEVSATFAVNGSAAAIGQVKQILLSSFATSTQSTRPGDILAFAPGRRDNGEGSHPAHLDKYISSAY